MPEGWAQGGWEEGESMKICDGWGKDKCPEMAANRIIIDTIEIGTLCQKHTVAAKKRYVVDAVKIKRLKP